PATALLDGESASHGSPWQVGLMDLEDEPSLERCGMEVVEERLLALFQPHVTRAGTSYVRRQRDDGQRVQPCSRQVEQHRQVAGIIRLRRDAQLAGQPPAITGLGQLQYARRRLTVVGRGQLACESDPA